MKHVQWLLIPTLAVAMVMTGCASKKPATTGTTTTLPTGDNTNNANGSTGANTTGMGDASGLNGQGMGDNSTGSNGSGTSPMDAMRAALANRVVHFDYDSSDLSQTDFGTLNAHSRYLAQNTGARVTLVGHTDERGTREYNLALGERRAKAVQAFLVTNGAAASQIDVVSYGKEKPVNEGHTDDAWAENRRVEIGYDALEPAK